MLLFLLFLAKESSNVATLRRAEIYLYQDVMIHDGIFYLLSFDLILLLFLPLPVQVKYRKVMSFVHPHFDKQQMLLFERQLTVV